jgi:hypothetical protein
MNVRIVPEIPTSAFTRKHPEFTVYARNGRIAGSLQFSADGPDGPAYGFCSDTSFGTHSLTSTTLAQIAEKLQEANRALAIGLI